LKGDEQKFMKVDRHTKLGKLMKMRGIEKILAKYNVPCISCPIAKQEMDFLELGYLCDIYGLKEKEMILEINNSLKKKENVKKKKA